MKNKCKSALTTNKKQLKASFNNNTHEILVLERRLSALNESELRSELCKLKNFERLNNEKITPYFLKMARSSKIDVSLDDLKNEQGTNFDSEENRGYKVRSNFFEMINKIDFLKWPPFLFYFH